jgi:hypothetical protein
LEKTKEIEEKNNQTYLGDIDKNHIIIVLQIDRMFRSHDIGNSFDHIVSVELCVASYRRPNSILQRNNIDRSAVFKVPISPSG